MNSEYSRKAPLVRFVFLAAALSVTLSIGGFIDLLASSQLAESADPRPAHPVRIASR